MNGAVSVVVYLVNRHSHRVYIALPCSKLRCSSIRDVSWWQITQISVIRVFRGRRKPRVSLFTDNTCVSNIRETSMAVVIDQDVPLNRYKQAKRADNSRRPHPLEITVYNPELMEIL